MTAIFTGLGSGLERGSGSALGSAGLLGSSILGRGGEQLFLNAASGNLVVTHQDEFVAGLGLDASVVRTYNSLGDLSDDNHDNWRQGYDRRIVNQTGTLNAAGSTVQRVSGDGSVITYNWDATAGAYLGTDGGGAYDRLSCASNVWTWTDGDSQVRETYQASGTYWRLTGQADTDGNTVSLSYDGNGMLAQVTTASGATGAISTLTYSWSGNDLMKVVTGYTDLTTMTAKTLTRTSYTYDQGRLLTVRLDRSPDDNVVDTNSNGVIEAGEAYVTIYTYASDVSGNAGFKRIASISQSDGSLVQIHYDPLGRVDTLTQTAATGVTRATAVSYDTANLTKITDPMGLVTYLAYDSAGQLTKVTLPAASSGAAPQQIGFTYNGSGDVLTVTDALGNVTTRVYDDSANPGATDYGLAHTITDRLGNVVTRQYGLKNELLTETTTSSDAASGAASHTVRFAYDGENHLRFRISAEGYVSEYRYTAEGLVSDTVDYPEHLYDVSGLGSTAKLTEAQMLTWLGTLGDKSSIQLAHNEYDARGALLSSESYGIATSGGLAATSEGTSKTNFVYDQTGQLRSRTVQGHNIETYVYDALNRLTAMVDVNGATTSYVFNDAATTTTVTFASGLQQVSVYNKAGELLNFTEQPVVPVTGDEAGGIARYYRDQDGRLRWQTDATGIKTYFLYDGVGRKTADISSAGDVVEYRYDANDRLIATIHYGTKFAGSLTALESENTPADIASYRPASAAGDLWSFNIYDKEGRLIEAVAGDGSASINSYDGAGRLIATSSYANRLTSAQLAELKSYASANLAPNLLDIANWQTSNATAASVTVNGMPGIQITNQTNGTVGHIDTNWAAHAGDTVTFTATLYASGSRNQTQLGIYDVPADWGDSSVSTATIISGPGVVGRITGAFFQVSNLSTTLGTTVVITRRILSDDVARAVIFPNDSNSSAVYAGDSVIVVNPGVDLDLGNRLYMPTSDARDTVARTFYDKDGRLLGSLDGEGYVVQFKYDKAGQKVQETRFSNATSAALRATGTFNQLVGSITPSAANDRQTYFSYDGQGQLRYVIDSLGYVVQTDYDSAGQATTVTRYAGTLAATADYTYDNVKALVASGNLAANGGTRRSWTVYDMAGRAAYAIDGENGVTGFAYSPAGQLIRTTQFSASRTTASLPLLSDMTTWEAAHVADTDNRVTRVYYDGVGALRYTVDAEGYVTSQKFDNEGRILKTSAWPGKITVDNSKTTGNIVTLVGASGGTAVETLTVYDYRGRVDTVTNAEGIVTRYLYNANELVSDEISAWGTTNASTTHFEYDAAGRIIRRSAAWGTSDVAMVETSYNGLGDVEWTADPLGRKTYNYYDRRGLQINACDPENYLTQTSYNAYGQVLSVTRRYTRFVGTPSVGTSPSVAAHAKDAITAFEYDRLGQVVKTTDAENFVETYEFNAFGNRTKLTNKVGGQFVYTYDRRGLMKSEVLPMAAMRADGTIQATSVTNTFDYDAFGNRTRMTEAAGLTEQRMTNYAYNRLGQQVSKSLDAATTVAYSDFTSSTAVTVTTTSGVVPTESYIYDFAGRLKQVTNALGGRTVSFYDRIGRKTAEVVPLSGTLGTLSVWTYNAADEMTSAKVYGDAIPVPAATDAAPNPAGNYRETLYAYDNLDRVKTTSVASVLVGNWNGTSGVSPTTQTITTTLTYDAAGNVVTTSDPRTSLTYAYFDGLGRKTAQLDAEGYLTSWSFDGEGNVLSERRYATKWTGAVTTAAPPAVATNAADRVTTFTYDRNGHRLTEARSGVVAYSVNAINGTVTPTATDSIVTYSYNGLGQVLSKQEATGDTVAYTYDQTGRLTRESRASYTDQTSASVTPTVDYLYTGVNNIARTRQGNVTAAAGDRITTYAYGANGRLASLTDAAGGTHSYDYDLAGNQVRDSYSRVKWDGTSTSEAILYRRDLLGRVTAQTIATNSSGSWTRGDSQNSEYNAYGEIGRRGLNGLWQESFTYDNAGRLVKNNSGDGVWRFFIYDANGNRTLTIESEGADLSGMTQAQALSLAQPGGVAAGSTLVTGINVGITVYDKRNQVTQNLLAQRKLSATGTAGSIITSQTYNAFGEVATQLGAIGNQQTTQAAKDAYTTSLTYNTMGRLIQKVSPQVSWTNSSGTSATGSPVETYYYDLGGRLVGSLDANGNRTSRTLLAGTGYGDADALVTAEIHADSGIAKTLYDVFGDARIVRNELNADETRTFDGMGRLITQVHRGALLTDNYTYDILGQRITHWNSYLGSANKEITEYDRQGRVVANGAFGGDTVSTNYVWDETIATTGMGTFGGWIQTDTYANARQMVAKSDMFGHDTYKLDLGNHSFTFGYDLAGRQLSRTTSGETQTTTWLNSGLVARVEYSGNDYSNFTYDAAGNRLTEYTVRGGVVAQNATVIYDALGRMTNWTEAGGTISPAASKTLQYDLNGNIMSDVSVMKVLDAFGTASTYNQGQSITYSYDAMNRVALSDSGSFGNGSGVGTSTFNSYDVAGQRIRVDQDLFRSKQVRNPYYDPDVGNVQGNNQFFTVYYNVPQREDFTYRADGALATIKVADGTAVDTDGDGTPETPVAASAPGTLRSGFTYDAMGRLTRQLDYKSDGTVLYDRAVTLNNKGQITVESVKTLRLKSGSTTSYDTFLDDTTTQYGAGTDYALGAATQIDTQTHLNGSDSAVPDPRTVNTYAWYDGAVISQTTFDSDINTSNPIYTTTYTNSASGVLTSAYVADYRVRTVTYTNDMSGEVIRRDEADALTTKGDPHAVRYRFNGHELSTDANVANPGDMTEEQSITDRSKTGAPTQTLANYTFNAAGATLDGNLSYDRVNSFKQGAAGGRYTVRGGDTLQAIAQNVWGDSSYWYKIAEANGLTADSTLIEGQTLTLPSGVTRSKNSATTFAPYDPGQAVGDTAPTTAKPPKKKKGGLFGQILLAVIQIAVTVLLSSVGVPAPIAAVIGNVVSQGVGVATGIQEKFSWKQVAMTAITASLAPPGTGNILIDAAAAAATNAIAQGVGVATGLQKKFDWVGVAAAGIGSAAGNVATKTLGNALHLDLSRNATGGFNNPIHGAFEAGINSAASAIANAATRSLANGTSFGDNIIAALPDAIAGTVGGFLQAGISMGRMSREVERAETATGSGGTAESYNSLNRGGILDVADRVFSRAIVGGVNPDGLAVYDLLLSKGLSPMAAEVFGTSPNLTKSIDQFANSASDAAGATNVVSDAIHNSDGTINRQLKGEVAGLNALVNLGRVSSQLETFKDNIHFDEIMMGVQILLGPAAAAKGLIAGLVGNATIGRYFEKSQSYLSSKIVQAASGLDADSLNDLLVGKSSIASADQARNEDLRSGYSDAMRGASFAVSTLGSIILGVGVKGVGALAAERAVPQVTTNRIAGNAFRDEVADVFRASGADITTEVYKSTPFGKRFIDIEVSRNGQALGGIETKLGGSRYTPAQRAKDYWLKINDGYQVDVLRRK